VRTTIEAYARYRVNSALSPSQFLQTDRDIRHCRRMLRAGN
jgi:hypothetical protein